MKYNILVIEDEKNQVELLSEFLSSKGFNCYTAMNKKEAEEIFSQKRVDLVITDYNLPDGNGDEIIVRFKEKNPEVLFIVITAFGDMETAIKCLKNGAKDFINKPINLKKIEQIVNSLLEKKVLIEEIEKLRRDLDFKYNPVNIQGIDLKFVSEIKKGVRVARTNTNVLITGESGTGKELFANLIHYNSPRKNNAFIKVNCSAIPDELIESELFGHKKGAFTGAINDKIGKFEAADGGTLFLDEIGELPLHIQVKLLRILQEREFELVGSNVTKKVDVRLIFATNRELEKEVELGNFREDFYYRINTVILNLPPLRERKSDIPILVKQFIKKFNERFNLNIKEVSSDAMDVLIKYNWPGNIRELENVIENSMVLMEEEEEILYLRNIPISIVEKSEKCGEELLMAKTHLYSYLERKYLENDKVKLHEILDEMESEMISWGLKKMDNVKSRVADFFQVDEKSIRYKIKKYNIKIRK